MTPQPEETYTGEEQLPNRLKKLADELDIAVLDARQEVADDLKLEGLLFEPAEGNVHPIVRGSQNRFYALGGNGLKSVYRISPDQEGSRVDWGGQAGSRVYKHIEPSDGTLLISNKEGNKLGLSFIPSTKDSNPVEGPMFFQYAINPGENKNSAIILLNETLKKINGNRVEFLDKVSAGLVQAGMKTVEEKAPVK